MIRDEASRGYRLCDRAGLFFVVVDTPKPAMIDHVQLFDVARKDTSVLKIELDHHLEADARYFGDPDYRLVYEASSTCEIIGRLALKMEKDFALKERYQVGEFLTRNLVLAILTGMIGDSQMGRFLKSRRERWFDARFSSSFERMLERKTRSGSGNFPNKEQVFEALAALSDDEDACYRFMSKTTAQVGPVSFACWTPRLPATFSRPTATTRRSPSRRPSSTGWPKRTAAWVLLGYYDDPGLSPFVQFRLRRSQAFTALHLREALALLKVTNGGGHPGAVGFRIEREAVPDIEKAAREFAAIDSGRQPSTRLSYPHRSAGRGHQPQFAEGDEALGRLVPEVEAHGLHAPRDREGVLEAKLGNGGQAGP